jgi:hypothetical protein
MAISILYLFYKINKLEKIEGFTTNTATQEQVNTAVKRIYLADVEAIRLLSNFAIQLSQGGTTVPGSVTFSGNNIIQGGDISGNKAIKIGQGEVKLVANEAQHYSIFNKAGKLSIENTSNSEHLGSTLGKKLIEITSDFNTKSVNSITVNDTVFGLGEIRDSSGVVINHFPTIDLGANDRTKATHSGKITYGVGDPNALNIFGKAPSGTTGQRYVRIWDKVQVDDRLDVGREFNVGNTRDNNGILNVNGTINCKSIKIGDWTLSTDDTDIEKNLFLTNNIYGTSFIFFKDGHFRVPDGMISTNYEIEFGSSAPYGTSNTPAPFPWRLKGQTDGVRLMTKLTKDSTLFMQPTDNFKLSYLFKQMISTLGGDGKNREVTFTTVGETVV